MTKFFGFASLLLSIIAPFGNAAALPNGITGADMVYPEVVPGPGLPSLAELGLSSKKLYEMPRKPIGPPIPVDGNHAKRAATSTPGCVGAKSDSANVDDVIACFNYMVEAGGVVFFVPNDEDQHILCTSGTAYVYAVDVGRWPTVGASALWDAALGVQWVFTYCNSGGQVEGNAFVYGDDNVVVVVGGEL